MKWAMIAPLLALAACGTTPGVNSDVPNVGYVGVERPTIADDTAVQIVDAGPAMNDVNQRVGGTSCKNKMWDPAPSEENAINLMKRQAAERGYNAIHSMKVGPDGAALMKNCWSAIHASGIAFKLPSDPN